MNLDCVPPRIKTFVFKFISVPAKWIKTFTQGHALKIYSDNNAYANLFQRQTLVKDHAFLVKPAYYLKSLYGVEVFCVDISVLKRNMYNKMNFCRFASKILNPIGCGFEG